MKPSFPLLSWCIFKELIQNFFLCIICLLTIILIGHGLQMRDLYMNLDLSPLDTGLLFFYMMPVFLLLILPISCMLSIFLTFLRMSSDRELVAVKAGGISIYQLIPAPFLFSMICMVFSFLVSLHGISWGLGNFRSLVLQLANTKARIVVQAGVFNQDLFGKTLFAKNVDPETGKLQHVLFEDATNNGETTITFVAPIGAIETDEEKGEILFSLYDGKVYQLDKMKISTMSFQKYAAKLDLGKLLSGFEMSEVRPKEMRWEDLLIMQRDMSAPSQRFQNKVAAEIQKRLSLPFACLVLGFFAMPIACAFEGVRKQFGVVFALGMFLVYYSLFSLGLSSAESGTVSPALSLWIPNLLFGLIAIAGMYYVGKERSPIAFFTGWLRGREKKQGKGL